MSCASGERCRLNQAAPATHRCPHCERNVHTVCGEPNPAAPKGEITYSHVCYSCFQRNHVSSSHSMPSGSTDADSGSLRTTRSMHSTRSTRTKSNEAGGKKSTKEKAARSRKERAASKKKATESPEPTESDSAGEEEEDRNWFSPHERIKLGKGWLIPPALQPGLKLEDLFPPVVAEQKQVDLIGQLVHIPANYWGVGDRWWEEPKYEETFRQMDKKTVEEKAVLVGKVIKKTKKRHLVALAINLNDDELADLTKEEVYRFLVDKSILSKPEKTKKRTWNMHTYFLDEYKTRKKKKKGAYSEYIRDIILGGLLQQPDNAAAAGDPVEMHAVMSTRGSQIDPYVHTMHSFATVGGGIARQQCCVLCHKEGRKKLTTFYCGLCVTTATQEEDRKPTKHAYCMDANHQCFARHVAACFHCQSYRGEIASRNEARLVPTNVAIAGPSYVNMNPRRMRRGKKKRKNRVEGSSII